jgi:hypothetical protein
MRLYKHKIELQGMSGGMKIVNRLYKERMKQGVNG